MSAVRIPRDPWPFMAHRTWREVLRTEALSAKCGSPDKMTQREKAEFGQLLVKARKHNPPADETERRA